MIDAVLVLEETYSFLRKVNPEIGAFKAELVVLSQGEMIPCDGLIFLQGYALKVYKEDSEKEIFEAKYYRRRDK
jgi:hypothetical protein